MKYIKLTPFLILFVITEILLILVSINYLFLDNKGGMALAGTIAFVAAIINFLIIVLEQFIANLSNVNAKLLWIIEIIIILAIVVYVSINGFSIG